MTLSTPAPTGHRPPSPRTAFVVWLRKTHGWIGLWGATLGLLFGTSGIWLNHRSVLHLRAEQARSNAQLALPDPAPADAAALAAWLQATLGLEGVTPNVRVEPATPVDWVDKPARAEQAAGRRGGDGERSRRRERSSAGEGAEATAPAPAASAPMQPEHWTINFGGPKMMVQAEYWVGNHSVGVRRTQNGFIATLTNLHKGVGMPVPWILLVDTLAGSLILLSLSGLALWMLTHRRRVVGVAIFGTALAVTAGLAIARL